MSIPTQPAPTANPVGSTLPSAGLDQPTTLSFPAILRNPGLKSRYAHLLGDTVDRSQVSKRKDSGSRSDPEGKRRIRRRENAKFVSNPHIVLPTSKDYSILSNQKKRTFPEPLPRSLKDSQTPALSSAGLNDPNSTRAGHFTLPLRGVRKQLRRCGPGAERLVQDVENELLTWLESGDVVLFAASGVVRDTKPQSDSFVAGPIREIERTPLRLVWDIEEDGFARFICHCVCRWHNVVSFSKADASESSPRLTYILRPNPSRLATGQASNALHHSLDTPPTTEFDSASSLGGVRVPSTQDSASEAETNPASHYFESESESVGDIDDDFPGSLSDASGDWVNVVPDMTDSITLPPITQHALRVRSSLVPTEDLQTLSISRDTGDDNDHEDGVGDTTLVPPRPRQSIPRLGRPSRNGSRSSSQHSSPSRSPSVRRRRAEKKSKQVALPLMGISKRGRASDFGVGNGNGNGSKTLWSFVYEEGKS